MNQKYCELINEMGVDICEYLEGSGIESELKEKILKIIA